MRFPLWHRVLCILSVSFALLSQPIAAQVRQDAQAMTVAKQAVAIAGGVAALRAILDYGAEGEIVYQSDEPRNGRVTISAKGYDQFRIDARLPQGTRSEVVKFGSTFLTLEDGTAPRPFSGSEMCESCLVLPHRQLWAALDSDSFRLLYKGTTDVDGRPAYDLQLQFILTGMRHKGVFDEEPHKLEFFIDTASFHVLMLRDIVRAQLMRTLHYSDYRVVSGVLVPFQIREEVGGLPHRQINLDTVRLNVGLEDSDFSTGTRDRSH